jgi:hypothetical protein
MAYERRLVSAALLLVAFGCVLVGAILLFVSAAPYEVVLRITRLASGSRNPLNHAEYSVLLPRILPGGLFYAVLGFTLLLFRRNVASWTAEAIRSLHTCATHGQQALLQDLRTQSPWRLLSLGLIVVVGIVLRVLYLGEPPRKDESFTYVVFAGRSIVHVLTLYPAPNNHILHTAFVWISCRLFGNSLWAMRLPALLAGVALIPATYITAMRFAGRNAALFAAGLIAVSGPFVFFSVNARGYAQQAVLTVIMLYLAAEILEGAPAVYWALLSAAAAAGFWTAPTMLYSYLLVSFWLLWAGGRAVLRPMIIAGAITALTVTFLYMPVILVAGPRALFFNPFVRPQPLPEFRADALGFPKVLLTFLHGGDPLAFVILIGVGVLLALVFKTSAGRRPAQLFVVLLVVLVGLPVLQRIVPFARALLPVLTVYYLVAAVGWSLAAEKPFALHQVPMLIAFLTLLAAVAFHLTRSGYIETNREFPESCDVAAYLATQLHPSDRLIISWSGGPQLMWQLRHARVPYLDYSTDPKAAGRVLVAVQDKGVLPPRTSRLDPSILTLDGTLREAGLNTSEYLPASLIYKVGRGEVFELTPRPNSR